MSDLRWIILDGGLRLPGFDHWRERATSKPSDPDDIRWDCSCGYAGSPETVRKHWSAMLPDAAFALLDPPQCCICGDYTSDGLTIHRACIIEPIPDARAPLDVEAAYQRGWLDGRAVTLEQAVQTIDAALAAEGSGE
jgi:hypothetical protein